MPICQKQHHWIPGAPMGEPGPRPEAIEVQRPPLSQLSVRPGRVQDCFAGSYGRASLGRTWFVRKQTREPEYQAGLLERVPERRSLEPSLSISRIELLLTQMLLTELPKMQLLIIPALITWSLQVLPLVASPEERKLPLLAPQHA